MTSESLGLHPRQEGERDRIQMLTDGVFAIVMTLLVLEIKPPLGADADLGSELKHLVPHFAVYFLTMLVLGGLWFRHRTEFLYVRKADHPLTWLNLGVLAFVALIPWSASLVAAHIQSPLAVFIFNINLALAWTLQQSMWLYATGKRHLAGELPVKLIEWSRIIGFLSVVDCLIAAGVAWINPIAALVLDLLAPLIYVTGLQWRLLHWLTRDR